MAFFVIKRGNMQQKKKPLSKTKDKAWKEFSRFIRTRDAIRTTGDTDNCICITCGKLVPFKQIQAGHYIAGRTNALLFDEDIVFGQCSACNIWKHGEQLEFHYALKKLGYTDEELERMHQLKYKTIKYTADDYEQIAQQYKDDTEILISALKLYGPFSPRTQKLVELPHQYKN